MPLAPKVFPEHIIRNDVEETQSNASSTDDLVRELLDPADRPRNVWHLVEGPKVQPDGEELEDERPEEVSNRYHEEDGQQQERPDPQKDHDNDEIMEKHKEIVDESSQHLSEPEPIGDNIKSSDNIEPNTDLDNKKEGRDEGTKESSKSRSERHRSHRDRSPDRRSSSSRRRHRHHDKDHHDRHMDRDREDQDSRRYRSHRRRDYSDDEGDDDHGRRNKRNDDDDRDERRRSSHRDHRRSRSRSKTSSRRRDRSRSHSQSPITKRNSKTILIMQLNPRVNSRDLEDFFSDVGQVREVRLIMDSKTRRHKGIAYIEFEDASAASKAFSLNGRNFFGAPIVIQSAQMERNRPSGDWHSSSSTSQNVNRAPSHQSSRSHLPPNCYRVYVGGLHVNLTEDMIRSVFEPFGPIIRLELMKDRITNVSRGYAFITYANIEDGQEAVQALDGFELAGKALRVSKSTDKSEQISV